MRRKDYASMRIAAQLIHLQILLQKGVKVHAVAHYTLIVILAHVLQCAQQFMMSMGRAIFVDIIVLIANMEIIKLIAHVLLLVAHLLLNSTLL